MLQESKIYSFLDSAHGFTIHFLEGQKLIHDLALTHSLQGQGFHYFRDAILTIQPMICFLKNVEGLGIYIDSEDPYFRLKVETNSLGNTRTLLLPEQFNEFPKKLTGLCRLTKVFSNKGRPYTSVIKIEDSPFEDVMNTILKDSYQIEGKTILSESTDQSLLVIKLPPAEYNKVQDQNEQSLKEYLLQKRKSFDEIFAKNLIEKDELLKEFESLGLALLGEKPVRFFCPCSKDRIAHNLANLSNVSADEIFDGKETIEVKCDYCKSTYDLVKEDLNLLQ